MSQLSSSDLLKKRVALAALDYIEENTVVGIGTGSTTNFFIDALASIKHKIDGCVASSEVSAQRLTSHGIPILELTSVSDLPIYVDGADEFDPHLSLIKGGGGALTREKIIASVAEKFICIVDESKQVDILGSFPLPIEVIPMARSHVARQIVKLGGTPEYREGFVTDNGNIILDIHHMQITQPIELESQINQIVGVVTNGLFASRPADLILLANSTEVQKLTR